MGPQHSASTPRPDSRATEPTTETTSETTSGPTFDATDPGAPPRPGPELAAALLDGVSELVAVLDDEGRFQLASPSWLASIGRQPTPGDALVDLVHHEDREMATCSIDRLVTGAAVAIPFRLRLLHGAGHEALYEVRCTDHRHTPGVGGILLTASARTWSSATSIEREDEAGPPARRSLLRIIDRVQRHAATTSRCVVVALVGLDTLGEVDDVVGFAGGDRVLSTVSARLRDRFGACAAVGRTGSGGLAVIRWGVAADDLDTELDQIKSAITEETSRSVMVEGRPYVPRSTVGVAVDGGTRSAESLLRDAGLAMRAAQRNSQRWLLHEPRMSVERTEQFELCRRVDHAIVQEQVDVAFQPILDDDGVSLVGMEALARFRGDLASVPIDRTINAAESSGSIVELGALVLRSALATVRSWTDFEGYVAVNVSPYQLALPEFEQQVIDELTMAGLPYDRLVLEVTESAMVNNDGPVELLARLRERGVRVAVDDFGTGHSSISRLHRLPIDILKIDREFIAELPSPSAGRIVRTISALAAANHLDVVAEGVERTEQLDALRLLGGLHVQGYLFGAPSQTFAPTADPVARDPEGEEIDVAPSDTPVVPVFDDHHVCFFDGADFVYTVTEFVAEGLRAGELVLCIAEAAHTAAVVRRLRDLGLDPVAARSAGQLEIVEPDAVLRALSTPDGFVDANRFEALARGLRERAARFAGFRVYGEVVSVLAERDDLSGALVLEDLWNRLGRRGSFPLLCGYASSTRADQDVLAAVCSRHVASN